MKIAIEINGVLRDTIGKIYQTYEKYYLNEVLEHSEDLIENGEQDNFKYEIVEPIDSLDLQEHFKFKNEEDLYNFLYEEFVMQIFGHAGSAEISTFNYLNEFYKEFREEHDITIISDEMGKSKPASLFFLSKFGCLVESVRFYNLTTKNSFLDEFDIIVTANPELITNPTDKNTVIKYNTLYNKNCVNKIEIDSLKELSEKIKELC